ncbi:MAG: response regulator [Verrucomicrobiota bacterium]
MNTELKMLLVEDNLQDAELTIRALKKRNLANNTIHVQDGQAALDYLFGAGAYAGRDVQHQPKVVLLDLKLPKLDGLEVLRQIRADPRTSQVPVVMLTSSREDQDVIEAYQLGVNSYIVKPVDFESFREVVINMGSYWMSLNVIPTTKIP